MTGGVYVAALSLDLSPRLLAALVPLFVLIGGLIVYCLVDLARAPTVRYLPKIAWAVVILIGSAPLGAILYLAIGKERYGGHDEASEADETEPKEHELV